MTEQPSWADLFERAESYDVTIDGIRRELTTQRDSDE